MGKINKDVLNKLRGSEERVEENRSANGDVLFFRPRGKGQWTTRILDNKELNGDFFIEVWAHWNVGPKKVRITCPRLTEGLDQECAICDAIEMLKETGNKEDLAIAKRMMPNPQFNVAMIDRNDLDKGVQVWSAPPTVFRIWKRDVEEEDLSFWDFIGGTDFIVDISEGKRTFDYSMSHFKRTDTPLFDDDVKIAEIIEQIPDLLELVTFPTYEEAEAELTGDSVEQSSSSSTTESESAPEAEEASEETTAENPTLDSSEGKSEVLNKLAILRAKGKK